MVGLSSTTVGDRSASNLTEPSTMIVVTSQDRVTSSVLTSSLGTTTDFGDDDGDDITTFIIVGCVATTVIVIVVVAIILICIFRRRKSSMTTAETETEPAVGETGFQEGYYKNVSKDGNVEEQGDGDSWKDEKGDAESDSDASYENVDPNNQDNEIESEDRAGMTYENFDQKKENGSLGNELEDGKSYVNLNCEITNHELDKEHTVATSYEPVELNRYNHKYISVAKHTKKPETTVNECEGDNRHQQGRKALLPPNKRNKATKNMEVPTLQYESVVLDDEQVSHVDVILKNPMIGHSYANAGHERWKASPKVPPKLPKK
ncbi:uncharacterized protein [Ptychodera flava]|uniref:uncharacterized protein n=1 Tax=Ptychodera flava TaxID=63121 RepID=UPI003969F01E